MKGWESFLYVFLIHGSPIPNVALNSEGERRDRGGRDQEKGKKP